MMKLQDVLLKAMAKKITWWEAAEIIGVTDRTMRRWRERLETDGYSGLVDRRKGKPSDKRVPLEIVELVLRLYKETYFDLNIRQFHEKLREEHNIELSYTWVQKALQGAGLVPGSESGASIGGGESGDRCRACCCTLMAASTSGLVINDGTT
ncbi:MAG: helix-turn-helix domain-containing protein [Bryobacteraceae bacterium]